MNLTWKSVSQISFPNKEKVFPKKKLFRKTKQWRIIWEKLFLFNLFWNMMLQFVLLILQLLSAAFCFPFLGDAEHHIKHAIVFMSAVWNIFKVLFGVFSGAKFGSLCCYVSKICLLLLLLVLNLFSLWIL